MRFSFLTHEVRKICEDDEFATITYGSAVGELLKIRLADLHAAQNMEDFAVVANVAYMCDGSFSTAYVELSEGFKLFLKADHLQRPPLQKNGDIDWNVVDYVQIQEIKKYDE